MGKRMKRHDQTCLLAQSDNTCLLQGREGACVLAVVVRRSRPCAIQMWRCRRSTRLNDVLVAYTGAVTSDHSCILGVVLQSWVGAAYLLQEIHW